MPKFKFLIIPGLLSTVLSLIGCPHHAVGSWSCVLASWSQCDDPGSTVLHPWSWVSWQSCIYDPGSMVLVPCPMPRFCFYQHATRNNIWRKHEKHESIFVFRIHLYAVVRVSHPHHIQEYPTIFYQSVVPENTHTVEGYWKFLLNALSQLLKFKRDIIEINWKLSAIQPKFVSICFRGERTSWNFIVLYSTFHWLKL